MYFSCKTNFFYFILQKFKDPYSLYWITYICVVQRKFENEDLVTEIKVISALINDWENVIAYWAILEKNKQGAWEHTFLKTPGIFRFLHSKFQTKQSFTPRNSKKIVLQPLEILRPTPRNCTWVSWLPLEMPCSF